MPTDREKTKAIEAALFRKYLLEQHGWAALREVTIADAVGGRGVPKSRRIDMLLMRTGRNAPRHERIALEIKVSRSDFKRDTAEKRRAWFDVADRFAYVAPVGMIAKSEVPAGCGLIEYDGSKGRAGAQLKWTVLAPKRTGKPLPFDDNFFAYLAVRTTWAEHKLRKTKGFR